MNEFHSENGRIHLFNMDCMAYMAQFPDGHFDLAIVDPPYGYGSVVYMPRTRIKCFGGFMDKYSIEVATIDANQRALNKVDVVHAQLSKETTCSFSEANTSPPPAYFEELMRVSRNQIIWGGNYFILPPSRGFVIWEKTSVAENFTMAMCEFAWLSFNSNSKIFKSTPQGTKKDPRIHPTQKPVKLYEWLLKKYAKEGDKILDTHLGSASSAIAAHRMGFEFFGTEFDSDYFQASIARFEREMDQIDMFASA